MSGPRSAALRVLARPVAGALERLTGLIRRRVIPVRRISVAEGEAGAIELLLRFDADAAVIERARNDLLELYDVVAVEPVAEPSPATREMAVVRLRPEAAERDLGLGRRIAVADGGIVLEITGAPDEVDSALASLRDRRLILGVVRTGEVAVPDGPVHSTRE